MRGVCGPPPCKSAHIQRTIGPYDVSQAILEAGKRGSKRLFDPSDGHGVVVLEWLPVDEDEEDGEHTWEAADGGTSATVSWPTCHPELLLRTKEASTRPLLHPLAPSQSRPTLPPTIHLSRLTSHPLSLLPARANDLPEHPRL